MTADDEERSSEANETDAAGTVQIAYGAVQFPAAPALWPSTPEGCVPLQETNFGEVDAVVEHDRDWLPVDSGSGREAEKWN